MGKQWYIVKCKPHRERAVSLALRAKGYEEFLPQYIRRPRWFKWRKCSAPLFPTYIFCRLNVKKQLPVLACPEVIALVGSRGVPTPMDNTQIEALRLMTAAGVDLAPWPYVRIGRRVRIGSGPLCGIEGILISAEQSPRVVVPVDLVARSVLIDVDCGLLNLGEVGLPAVAYSAGVAR